MLAIHIFLITERLSSTTEDNDEDDSEMIALISRPHVGHTPTGRSVRSFIEEFFMADEGGIDQQWGLL